MEITNTFVGPSTNMELYGSIGFGPKEGGTAFPKSSLAILSLNGNKYYY